MRRRDTHTRTSGVLCLRALSLPRRAVAPDAVHARHKRPRAALKPRRRRRLLFPARRVSWNTAEKFLVSVEPQQDWRTQPLHCGSTAAPLQLHSLSQRLAEGWAFETERGKAVAAERRRRGGVGAESTRVCRRLRKQERNKTHKHTVNTAAAPPVRRLRSSHQGQRQSNQSAVSFLFEEAKNRK